MRQLNGRARPRRHQIRRAISRCLFPVPPLGESRLGTFVAACSFVQAAIFRLRSSQQVAGTRTLSLTRRSRS